MKKLIPAIAFLLAAASFAAAQEITDIQKVDFSNYTHKIGKDSIKFKDGLQTAACLKDTEGISSGEIWSLDKSTVKYGDLDGDGKAEAFMSAVANVCDGNMITNEAVLVYTLKKGKIIKLPEFEYFEAPCKTGEKCDLSRSPGVSVSFDEKAQAVIVDTSFSTDDDAICCPSFHRQTWFKWNGTKFTELKKSKIEKLETQEN